MKTKLDELAEMLVKAEDEAVALFVAGELEKMAKEIEETLTEGENQLILAKEEEERTEEAMDSMERRYWEGYTEALGIFSAVEVD
jgi:sulfite reductase alpha subunit-like flavoprotein